MGPRCAGKGCRLDSQARRSERSDLDLDALIAQELDTGASVDSTTPVLPEERRIPNDKPMEQDAHLARLLRGAALPLTLLAHRAGTTTAAASLHTPRAGFHRLLGVAPGHEAPGLRGSAVFRLVGV